MQISNKQKYQTDCKYLSVGHWKKIYTIGIRKAFIVDGFLLCLSIFFYIYFSSHSLTLSLFWSTFYWPTTKMYKTVPKSTCCFFLAFKFLFLLLLYLNFFTFKWWSSLYEMYKKMQSVLTIITIVVKIGSKISDFLRMTLTMAWWWRFLKTISVFALYIEGKNIPRDLRSIYPFPNHLVLKHHADDKKMFLKFFLIFSYSSSVLTLSNWIYVFFLAMWDLQTMKTYCGKIDI